MVWDPKDPWSKRNDPLEEALKQAQTQFRNFIPTGGFKNILLAALVLFLVWQSAFIVAPDEEGVVTRFGVPVLTVGPGAHGKIPVVETVLPPKVTTARRRALPYLTDCESRPRVAA